MAEPMILELLSNLKTRVATNEINIATNTADIATNRADFDTHAADDVRHWTTADRQNFDRVVHFKGYYTTEEKLKEAYATAELGDYAIVGETDTVWAWDDETNSWLNTTEQGIVISVNGRTGEVVLTKTDVGLGNVDNTADVNKPISTSQQEALNTKADRLQITESDVDSFDLRAGVYDLNGTEKTILGVTSNKWTIIVGEDTSKIENEEPEATQIWMNYDEDNDLHMYMRRRRESSWSDFKELMSNVEINNLQTQITQNTNDIEDLQNNRAERKSITIGEVNQKDLRSGIYYFNEEFTINGFQSEQWEIIISEKYNVTDSKNYSTTQIWMNSDIKRIFYRIYDEENNTWSNFSELITTDNISLEELGKVKQYKGYYNTLEDLTTDIPTGTSGDYAVVGNAFYVWDEDATDWKRIAGGVEGDNVTTVNGKTGDVVLTKNDIGLTNVDNTADKDKEVKNAKELKTARTIDGVSFDGSANITHYGVCSTVAETANKEVPCTGFVLAEGALINVKFNNTNTASVSSLTLNVNSTGAKSIKYKNQELSKEDDLQADNTYTFIYDGTAYQLIGSLADGSSDKVEYTGTIVAGENITASSIIVGKDEKYYEIATDKEFDITYPILYSVDSINKDDIVSKGNYIISPCNVGITLVPDKPVYLVGNFDNPIFTIDFETVLTQTEPTEEDGKNYLLLGIASNSSEMFLLDTHPIYSYVNGKFLQSSGGASDFVKKDGDTMTGDLTLEKGKVRLTNNASVLYDEENRILKFVIDDTVVAVLNSNGVFTASGLIETEIGAVDPTTTLGKEELPIGTILVYPSDNIPNGWLLCDGQEVSIKEYKDLYDILGTLYGTGNGKTTFNVPDFKTRVPVGLDSNIAITSTLGYTAGERSHILTASEIPSTVTTGSTGIIVDSEETVSYTSLGGNNAIGHNNMQPYIVQNYIIKAKRTKDLVEEIRVLNEESTSTEDTYSANFINSLLGGASDWSEINNLLDGKVDKETGKGLSSNDYTTAEKTKLEYSNIAYATCSTEAAIAEKVITIQDNTNWELKTGSLVMVKFSATNTAENPKFNVNGTGAKSVWYNTAVLTTGSKGYAGTINRPMLYMYDGTNWVFISWSVDSNTNTNVAFGQGYGTCTTAEATVAKVVTLASYALVLGGIVSVKFSNAVPANATMNINNKGAKSIYYKGSAITAGIINAGDIGTFIYNGSQYILLATDDFATKTYVDEKIGDIESLMEVL